MVNATPRPFYPRERPGTHCTGGWVGPRAGLDGCGKSRSHWDSIPGPSPHRPRHPGPPYTCRTHTTTRAPIHTMMAYKGSGSIAPLIINLATILWFDSRPGRSTPGYAPEAVCTFWRLYAYKSRRELNGLAPHT